METNPIPTAQTPEPTPRRPKRLWLALAGLSLIVLLAGGAYMAGQLLAQNGSQGGQMGGLTGSGGEKALRVGGPGGMSVELKLRPAPELPETPPETSGIFVRRSDNSLFVGTGMVTFSVSAGPNGEPAESSSDYDGPLVEVVVTSQTEIYRDATFSTNAPSPEDGEIQQKVEPGDIEELGSDSAITVWGKKSGDRVIADILVYSSPTIMVAPK